MACSISFKRLLFLFLSFGLLLNYAVLHNAVSKILDNDISSNNNQTLLQSPLSPATATATATAAATTNSSSFIKKQALKIHQLLCETKWLKTYDGDWKIMCNNDFVKQSVQLLLEERNIEVVQIGAHVGFERNDPIAEGLIRLLDEVEVYYDDGNKLRKRFHWTFVEPSPPNFKRLQENLKNNSAICNMKGINAAVVSDSVQAPEKMTFYTLRDTIDPTTGFDSLSGKKLPHYITQVSSLSKEPILYNKRQFTKLGLDVNDYIVESNVDTKSFSLLMEEALMMQEEGGGGGAFLLLIDTEGFDCDIIKGISPSSKFLPKYLLYEHKQCNYTEAEEHLSVMGYSVFRTGQENTLAVKKKLE